MRFEIREMRISKKWKSYFMGANNEKIWWTEGYETLANAKHAVSLINDKAAPYSVTVYNQKGAVIERY